MDENQVVKHLLGGLVLMNEHLAMSGGTLPNKFNLMDSIDDNGQPVRNGIEIHFPSGERFMVMVAKVPAGVP